MIRPFDKEASPWIASSGSPASCFSGSSSRSASRKSAIERSVAAQTRGAVQAPRFEVDFAWPKPLPNHWVLGNAIGVWADERDHIWIVHRGSETLANNEKGPRAEVG